MTSVNSLMYPSAPYAASSAKKALTFRLFSMKYVSPEPGNYFCNTTNSKILHQDWATAKPGISPMPSNAGAACRQSNTSSCRLTDLMTIGLNHPINKTFRLHLPDYFIG